VLRSWFPESTGGLPGRKRPNRGGPQGPAGPSRSDGNRARPTGQPDNFGNVHPRAPQSGSPGNSVHDGPPRGPRNNNNRNRRGPR